MLCTGYDHLNHNSILFVDLCITSVAFWLHRVVFVLKISGNVSDNIFDETDSGDLKRPGFKP